MNALLRLLCVLLPCAPLAAQANTIPGLDLQLLDTWSLNPFVREGTHPDGVTAVGAWTTCCNPGSVAVPFMAAMQPDHAFIHFLLAREADGRLVQISSRGYVKHTFGSSNDNSPCGSCAGPGRFSWVEVGCSDTYASWQAVDHFLLGPPDEVDPWLGTWVPNCSYFDRGDPPAPPGEQCDGVRSLTWEQANALNQGIHHQTRVVDAELAVAGATYWWQAGYLAPREAEANRDNNLGSREFFPSWNGSDWSFTDGPAMLPGTVLQRWTGATISSATNGADDGRFHVAVKVTGPVGGRWHYEYAVHNRDNRRGLGAFRIPICPDARASGFGFHDVDQDPNDDWVGGQVGAEIAFTTSTNPLRWNSIFNFWFDCDAAPVAGSPLALDAFDPGAGAPTIAIASSAPLGLRNVDLGPGCGNPSAPRLHATGAPAWAALGNPTFALHSDGNPAGALCAFVLSFADGATVLAPGCVVYSADPATLLGPLMTTADPAGLTGIALPVPPDPVLEGTHLDFQLANFQAGGAFLGNFNLSNGLRVRIGTSIAGCP